MLYYGNQQQLDNYFVVAPGADPRLIQIVFDGAKNIKVDRNGDVMRTAGQSLRFRRPTLYQNVRGEKLPVAGHYTLISGRVGFTASSYDISMPLVIDPVLVYSTLFGAAAKSYFPWQRTPWELDLRDRLPNYPDTKRRTTQVWRWLHIRPAECVHTKITRRGCLFKLIAEGWNRLPWHRCRPAACQNHGTAITRLPTVKAIQSTLRALSEAFVTKLNAGGNALIYSTYLGGSGKSSGSCAPVSFNCVRTGDRGNAIAVDRPATPM